MPAPDASRFSPHMAARFADLLARREDGLRAQLAALAPVAATPEGSGHEVADTKDQADELAARTLHDAQQEQALAALEQVRAAQRRLQDGAYGECVSCGGPVGLRRLEHLPEAARCLACQEAHEHARQPRA